MLNTHQSHKGKSWKYTLILPVLIGFVLLFQIKTIAQEKESNAEVAEALQHREEVRLVINKNSSEADLKREAKKLKEEHGITLKCSKIKRNSNGEITAIKVEYKDKKGNKGVSHVESDEPIAPIHFYKNNEAIGFGKPRNNVKVYANVPAIHLGKGEGMAFQLNDSLAPLTALKNFNFDFDMELPEPPEPPEVPEIGYGYTWNTDTNSKIVIKKGDKKPMVMINGKVLTDDAEIEKALKEGNVKGQYSICIDSEDGKESKVTINGKSIAQCRADVKAQVSAMRPQIKKQIEIARADKQRIKEEIAKVRVEAEKRRPEIDRARSDAEASRQEIEKARAEIEKNRVEMAKVREEMAKVRAELEKAKAEAKKQK